MKNTSNKRKYSQSLGSNINTVGICIQKRRIELNLSRKEVSDNLMLLGIDIPIQSIYDIEKGKRAVLDYELCAFAIVLKTSADELLKYFKSKLNNIYL